MVHAVSFESRIVRCAWLALCAAACTSSPKVAPAAEQPEVAGSQATGPAPDRAAPARTAAEPDGPGEPASRSAPDASAPEATPDAAPADAAPRSQPADAPMQPGAAGDMMRAMPSGATTPPQSPMTSAMQPPAAGDTSGAGAPPPDAITWPEDCEERYMLRAHGEAVPNDPTKFKVKAGDQLQAVFYFKAPWTGDRQLFKSHFHLDNPKVVHHWALWATATASAPDWSIDVSEESMSLGGEQYVAGGGAGGDDLELPPNIGLRLPIGSSLLFELELHYFNGVSDSDELDGSSFEMCVSSKKRQIEAAIHTMGLGTFTLPAHKTTDITYNCVPVGLDTQVHLLTVQPHMHRTGRHSKVVLNRKAGDKVILHDNAYDFVEQRTYALPEDHMGTEVLLQPGDTLTGTCTFENDTDSPIKEGIHSQDEMCNLGILAWPAGKLHNSYGAIGELLPGFGGLADVSCVEP